MPEFRLLYRGPLKSKKSMSALDTQIIRRHFHHQLKILWSTNMLAESRKFVDPSREVREGDINLVEKVGPFFFAPIVSQAHGWNTVSEIDILFLRPADPGDLLRHGGDLDNRLKSLFDALRVPKLTELPQGDAPTPDELPFYCLLQDDALVTAFKVTTDRLLVTDGNAVELVIHVKLKTTRKSMGNHEVS